MQRLNSAVVRSVWVAVVAAVVPAAEAEWVTDFWDGFGGTNGLNLNKWAYDRTDGEEDITRGWASTTAAQANPSFRDARNVADAVSVQNGILSIRTYTGTNIDPQTGQAEHKTGRIRSREEFRRGRFSAKMRFNSQPGMWSAFWLTSRSVSQNASGNWVQDPKRDGVEVDVVEHRAVDNRGRPVDDIMHSALHWNGYANRTGANQNKPDYWGHQNAHIDHTVSDMSRWHTYAVEWWGGRYVFFVDGQEVWRTNDVDVTSPTNLGDAVVSNIDQYMLLTSEVWLNRWAGNPPTGGYGALGASTNGLLEVDWVKHEYWDPTAVSAVPEPSIAALGLGVGLAFPYRRRASAA
ncbi:MAG: glycoside hydrolase family 16 protein [Planctomycetota bacterium]